MENLYHMEKQGKEPGEVHEQLMRKHNPEDGVVCDAYELVEWTEKVGLARCLVGQGLQWCQMG